MTGEVLSIPQSAISRLRRRLESKITINDIGCHEWTAFTTPDGYGMVKVAGRMIYAHRVAWKIA